jgi:predicted transcriptional regulator
MSIDVLDMSPARAAAQLAAESDSEWLDAFLEALDRQRAGSELRRVLSLWDLSQAEAGRMFGVSRQAVAKWLAGGLPAERLLPVAELAAATDILVHYLKRERIPAVVRRPAARLGDRSLLSLAGEGRTAEVLAACREMFDVASIMA